MTYLTNRSLLVLIVGSALAMEVNAQVADAGPDTSLCVNYYTMQGSSLPVGANGVWTLVMGCGTLNAPNDPSCPVTDMCIGSNVFVWTVDDNGTITTDQVEITVFNALAPVADAGPDQTVSAPPGTAFMNANPYTWPQYCFWTVVAGSLSIMNPTDPNTMLSGLLPGANTLRWTCINGPCGASQDDVVLNCFVWTGLGTEPSNVTNSLSYDPINHQILLREAAVLEALDVMGMDGRAILHAGGGYRTISTASLPDGVYLARAVVDGRPEVLRFVVSD